MPSLADRLARRKARIAIVRAEVAEWGRPPLSVQGRAVYGWCVEFLPHESLELESTLGAATVRANIPRAVDRVNQGTVILGLRCEVDGEQVRVGWWPRTAFVRAGVGFEGTVSSRGPRTLVTGEIRYFPPWHTGLVGVVVVLAAAIAVIAGIREGQPVMGLVAGAWMGGGWRIALAVMFRAHERRIVRALRMAAGVAEATSVAAGP